MTPALRNLYNYQIGQKLRFVTQTDTIEILLASKENETFPVNSRAHYTFCKYEEGKEEILFMFFETSFKDIDSLYFSLRNYTYKNEEEYVLQVGKNNYYNGILYLNGNSEFIKSKSDTALFPFLYNGVTYPNIYRTSLFANYQVPEVISFLYFVDELGWIGFDTKDGKEYRLVQ